MAPSLRAEKMKPRKIDLQSPQPVIIDISTGGSAFNDIVTFRLFDETFQGYMQEMEGITKCPSSSKKRKTDSKWCLGALAKKFGIDMLNASASVLKEHVAHMATVAHLF